MRWRILALLFFARVGLGFQFQSLGSVADALVDDFGMDYARIGLLIGLFMAPGLFLALPAGFLSRYVADHKLIVLGLGALALGGALSGLAQNSATIGLGRLIAGAGFVLANLYLTKIVVDWFETREIATAMSVLVMSWPFGVAMGQVGHVWLAQTFDWRAAFLVASAYGALAACAMALLYRPPAGAASGPARASFRMSAREWSLIICAGMAWGLFNAGYVVYLSFAPAMLVSLGQGAVAAAGIISVGSWLMLLSGTTCGWIADRYGRQNIILAICICAAMLAMMLLSLPGAGLPASLLFGLLGMAPVGLIMALAGQAVAPERRAFGMGVFFTIYHAFMTAAPPVAGAIFDRAGTPQAVLWFGIMLFAAVLPATYAYRVIRARPLPDPK